MPRTQPDPYDAEERAFLRAIAAYRRKTNRHFLLWHEILAVVRAMGYRRVEKAIPWPPQENP